MSLKLKTPPAPLIVLADAKAWLRQTSADQDSVIQTIINSTTAWTEKILGRCLLSQVWEYYPDAFPAGDLEIPLGDLISVDTIEYKDPGTGSFVTWSSANYTVDTVAALVKPNSQWPTAKSDVLQPIRITFTAGYGANPADVPPPIVEAVMIQIVDRFDNRSAVSHEAQPTVVPMGVDWRIAPFRRVKF